MQSVMGSIRRIVRKVGGIDDRQFLVRALWSGNTEYQPEGHLCLKTELLAILPFFNS